MALGAKITDDVGRLADGFSAADGSAAELDDETLHKQGAGIRGQGSGGARCKVESGM